MLTKTLWIRQLSVTFILSIIFFCGSAFSADYVSHRLDGQTLHIKTTEGELALTAYGGDVFEAHYIAEHSKQLQSFSINREPIATAVNVDNKKNSLDFSAGKLTAKIEKSPLRVSYYRGKDLLLAEEKGFFNYEALRGFRFELQDQEKLLGGGERILGMDRRGTRMSLYNKGSFGYDVKGEQMYYGLPVLMSSRKYMLIFDNTARGVMDVGMTQKNILQLEAASGRSSYLVVAGENYPSLINNFVSLTGTQPIPPMWTFGNLASRFGYRSEAQTREVVAQYKTDDIPLDAVILDLYWFGPDIKGHMGTLDWDKNTFPTPQKMMADFAKDGIKTVVITEPFILKSSKRWQEAVDKNVLAKDLAGNAKAFPLYFGETGIVDVFDKRGADWFSNIYEGLLKQGVTGIWGDLGEPEAHPADTIHALGTGDELHNVYGHKWTQIIDEAGKKVNPNERLFILARSGFVGTQRYGILPWTGDVSRSWAGLAAQVELSLSMGITGLGYMHSDLGGFTGDDVIDNELYTRWLQYGVFQPIYRPHASDNINPEPVFAEPATKNIVRDFIKLRYKMLPYNYTLAYENSTTGIPLMRPMFLADESKPALMDEKFQYMWGDAFLVKPVVEAKATSVKVDLPRGNWFNFWNDEMYAGDKSIDFPVTIKTLPVLVRAGAFIPMIEPIATTRDYSTREITLHYYADKAVKKSAGKMYEDDGISRDSLATNQYALLHFNAEQKNNTLAINFSKTGLGYEGMPSERNITLVIHNWKKSPTQIKLADEIIPITSDKLATEQAPAAHYDAKTNQLTVKVRWSQAELSLKVN